MNQKWDEAHRTTAGKKVSNKTLDRVALLVYERRENNVIRFVFLTLSLSLCHSLAMFGVFAAAAAVFAYVHFSSLRRKSFITLHIYVLWGENNKNAKR